VQNSKNHRSLKISKLTLCYSILIIPWPENTLDLEILMISYNLYECYDELYW
jgi:hypothetical protein